MVSTKKTIWTAPSATARGPARRSTSRTPGCPRSSENEYRVRRKVSSGSCTSHITRAPTTTPVATACMPRNGCAKNVKRMITALKTSGATALERGSHPRTRLATRVAIMMTEARATDIGTGLILRHPVSFAADGNEETQAFRAQAHPADPAPHSGEDARAVRGAHRGPHRARDDRERRRGCGGDDLGGRERTRQSGQARRDPPEQRAPSAQPGGESRGEEQEELISQS